jgi:hypothetical protein
MGLHGLLQGSLYPLFLPLLSVIRLAEMRKRPGSVTQMEGNFLLDWFRLPTKTYDLICIFSNSYFVVAPGIPCVVGAPVVTTQRACQHLCWCGDMFGLAKDTHTMTSDLGRVIVTERYSHHTHPPRHTWALRKTMPLVIEIQHLKKYEIVSAFTANLSVCINNALWPQLAL